MKSLQVIQLADSLPVARITALSSEGPYRLHGRDFRFVENVLFNGADAPTFVIESRTTILATLPVPRSELREVMVLSSQVTMTERSLVRLQLGGGVVEGITRLVQRFTKLLLQTPGSDIFSPEDGGGLRDLVGYAASVSGVSDLVARHNLAISRTREQIQRRQARSRQYIPAAERLVGAEVLSVDFDRDTGTLRSRVRLQSAAGDALLNLATV